MSIHMHDLQVQNKITSKNEIETENLKINGIATINTLNVGTVDIGNTLQTNSISVISPIPNQSTLIIGPNSLMCDSNTINLSELTINNKKILVKPESQRPASNVLEPIIHLGDDELHYSDYIYVKTYGGKTTIWAPDFTVYTEDQNEYLTQQTINIAGHDVKIWGGSLEANTLATSLSNNDNLIPKNAISAAQADLALKAQALDVTSTNGVGDFSQPVYFDVDGKPQPCSFITATKLLDDVNVGAEDTPIYFKGGVPMACTELYAAEAGHADEADVAMSAEIALSLRLPDNPENPPETSKKGQVFFKIDYNNSHTIQQENGVWHPLIPYIFIPNN